MNSFGPVAGAAVVVATVAALVSIWRSAAHSPKVKLIWTLLALIPLVGPVAWFALGRGRRVR
jgi:bacteriorhodopsin